MNGQIQFGDVKPVNYFLTIAVVLGLMFTFIAPDTDTQSSWLANALHWQVQTVIPMVLAILMQTLLSKSTGPLNIANPWFRLVISGVIACILVTPIALTSDVFLANEPLGSSIASELFDEFFGLTPPVLICWIAINAPFVLGWRTRRAKASKRVGSADLAADDGNQACADFLKLIPAETRGELIFLKSELHYLQVVTTKGKALILYSLKAAMSELESDSGVQPHRSYWVSKSHIKSLTKNGREGILQLSNHQNIPVSRSKMSVLTRMIDIEHQ